MIELDITEFFNTECPRDYSASVAELGPTAGRDTWQAAVENAPEHHFVNDDNRDDVIAHFLAYGAWDESELEACSNDELCAMLIQDISSEMREAGIGGPDTDWDGYGEGCEAGRYRGSFFVNVEDPKNPRVYFTIGG